MVDKGLLGTAGAGRDKTRLVRKSEQNLRRRTRPDVDSSARRQRAGEGTGTVPATKDLKAGSEAVQWGPCLPDGDASIASLRQAVSSLDGLLRLYDAFPHAQNS